jgi:hypothetical protein
VVRNRYLTRATRRDARRDAAIIVWPDAALTGRREGSAGRTRPRSRRRPPGTAALPCDPPMLRHHRRRGRDPHKSLVSIKDSVEGLVSGTNIIFRGGFEFVHIISEGARCAGGARVVGGRGMHRCCYWKKVSRDRALDISQTPTRWVLFPFLDIEPTVF